MGSEITPEIIFEYCPRVGICVVRVDYASSLEHLINLFNKAQEDFPGLEFSDARVKFYAGDYIARTFGIEFKASPESVPKHYQIIEGLEPTY